MKVWEKVKKIDYNSWRITIHINRFQMNAFELIHFTSVLNFGTSKNRSGASETRLSSQFIHVREEKENVNLTTKL